MNNKDKTEFILTLSCPDTSGIVAEVAVFVAVVGTVVVAVVFVP